jgi:two-component sensor histidine kinase
VIDSEHQFKKLDINLNGTEVCSFAGTTLMTFNTEKEIPDIHITGVDERVYYTFFNLNNEIAINATRNYLFRNRQIVPYPELSRFDNKIITDHLFIGDSAELFKLENDSIFLLYKSRFYNLSHAFGTSVDMQIRNIIYHDPVLYLATSKNIYWCQHPLNITVGKKVQLRLLDIDFTNIHDILVNNDSLYVASDDGLTIIPETLTGKAITHIPVPYLRSISINDQEKDPSGQEWVTRGNTKVEINFGCVNYSSKPVIFAYLLEGLDTSWTLSSSGNVVYRNLLSGDYKFKLKVRKYTSGWSKVTERRITVKSFFWQHPIFYISLLVLLLTGIAGLIIRRKNSQLKRREIDHQLILLEQKALQSMMNPHFIFNSLGSIQNFLLQEKSGEAALYLSQFARLIRQNMNAINAAMINLEEEVDRLKNYLDLERLRMENKFEYRIDVDENVDADEILIPSMIIQPFVENSIWHGISAIDGPGLITIHFSQQDEKSLTIAVVDNGIGIKKAQTYQTKGEKHLNIGMGMTRRRLEILGQKYSVETRVEFSEASPGNLNPGTKVVMILPFSYIDSAFVPDNKK